MKIKYKFLSLMLALILPMHIVVMAETNASWKYEDGVLTFSGTYVEDFKSSDEKPWDKHKDETKKIVFNDGIQIIGDWSFAEFNKVEELSFPKSLQIIGERAFYNCTGLSYINLPNGLKNIEDGAFNSCKGVVRIKLPETLEVIGNSAFMNLPKLTVITIPKSVESIGKWAFMGNTSLKQLYFEGDVPQKLGQFCLADINDDYYLFFTASEIKSWKNFDMVEEERLYAYYPEERLPVYLNNQEICFDVDPVISNGRTLVPMRAVFEALGAVVVWDGETETATATKDDIKVSVTIGADTMRKNNQIISLDCPAQLVSSRTFVPVRAIAEAFGAKVDWNSYERAVYIEF